MDSENIKWTPEMDELASRLISPIPPENQAKRGWVARLDGKVVEVVSSLEICNPLFGCLSYGWNGSFDGIVFHENGGGGSIVIPYAVNDGRLMVGMISQFRLLQGGTVWNVPRGFLDANEKHFEAAKRELAEEIGLLSPDMGLIPLEGEPGNPNSAFFDTSREGEGCHYYRLEVLPKHLEYAEDGLLKIKDGLCTPVSKLAKQVYSCRFQPWREMTKVGDDFSGKAFSRLWAAVFMGS